MVLNFMLCSFVFQGQSLILTASLKNFRAGSEKYSIQLKTQEEFRSHGLEFAQEARANSLNSCAKCLSFGPRSDKD